MSAEYFKGNTAIVQGFWPTKEIGSTIDCNIKCKCPKRSRSKADKSKGSRSRIMRALS